MSIAPVADRPGAGAPVVWQASLLAGGLGADPEPAFDPTFATADRRELSGGAWVEHVPGWLHASDELFDRVLRSAGWGQRTMEMYGEVVTQPRLSAHWVLEETPEPLAVLKDVSRTLTERYGVDLCRVSCNLYRDGQDSVAWHGDRVARELPTATVAILGLGHRRSLRLRPRGGGASLRYEVGRGDLFVMGGSCQRTWQHAVPKVRHAGPRIAVMFRHVYDER